MSGVHDLERRVLVLAPTERDAQNTTRILQRQGIGSTVCRDIDALCREIAIGAGAVVLTEETLGAAHLARLVAVIEAQPHWSDLPFVALTRGGPDSEAATHAMESLGNVILLERPVRLATFVTATRTALRERTRQY